MTSCGQPLQIPTTTVEVVPAQAAPTPTLQSRPAESSLAPSVPTILLSPAIPATDAATTALPAQEPRPPIVIVPHTATAQNNQQRWRAQQINRQVISPTQFYMATAPVEVYWFESATGQSIVVGRIVGAFPVQASFTFRPSNMQALEIPYKIGQDLGLTALSSALTDRLHAAGYTTYAEVYVLKNASVELRR